MKKGKLWFKAKLFGWGWYPATWEGWLITFVSVALICSHMSYLGLFNAEMSEEASLDAVFTLLPYFVFYTAVFVWVAYKTGEKPRWRWGRE